MSCRAYEALYLSDKEESPLTVMANQIGQEYNSHSEIAYELGFEHLQSFSKLFKTRAKLSPLEFRHSFN